MAETDPTPAFRRAEEIEYESVSLADGLSKGVLLGETHAAQTATLRRFELAPGAEVPRHTNEREHEQYVLAGKYTVGIGEERYTVTRGDTLLIPAGVEHWYRNETDDPGAFLCVVPCGEGEVTLTDKPASEQSP